MTTISHLKFGNKVDFVFPYKLLGELSEKPLGHKWECFGKKLYSIWESGLVDISWPRVCLSFIAKAYFLKEIRMLIKLTYCGSSQN